MNDNTIFWKQFKLQLFQAKISLKLLMQNGVYQLINGLQDTIVHRGNARGFNLGKL